MPSSLFYQVPRLHPLSPSISQSASAHHSRLLSLADVLNTNWRNTPWINHHHHKNRNSFRPIRLTNLEQRKTSRTRSKALQLLTIVTHNAHAPKPIINVCIRVSGQRQALRTIYLQLLLMRLKTYLRLLRTIVVAPSNPFVWVGAAAGALLVERLSTKGKIYVQHAFKTMCDSTSVSWLQAFDACLHNFFRFKYDIN